MYRSFLRELVFGMWKIYNTSRDQQMREKFKCRLCIGLLHFTQGLCNGEFGSCLLLDLIHTHAWSSLDQSEATSDSVNIENSLGDS